MTAAPETNPLRILLLEDDEHDVNAFRRAFRGSEPPARITICSRAAEAMEILAADPSGFDLVVSDYNLPGVSGLELFKDLLAREVQLPLVMLTGTGSESIAVEALKAGVYDYLLKDPNGGYLELLPVVLAEVVRKHADRMACRRAEEALRRAHAELERKVEERTLELSEELDRRKRSEAALAESEKKYRTIIDTTSEGYWRIDPDSRETVEVNDSLCRLLGYTREEMIGKTPADFSDGENRKIIDEQLSKIPTAEQRSYEVVLKARDGAEIFVHVNATTIHDASNRPLAAFALVTDITERKRAEIEILRAKEKAELANRTKIEFLANMSHELRTPLNAVIGFSDALRSGKLGPLDNPKHQEYVQSIFDSGTHLHSMIVDILDVSKIEAGKLELHEEKVDVAIVVDASVRMVRGRAEDKGVRIEVEFAKNLPSLHADELRVKQILLNILSNAVKFTAKGGEVKVAAARAGDGGLAIAVTDSGVGMSEKDIAKALETFGQVDTSISRQHQGAGLGIPLTKGLVELHGGRLDISSQPGQGTRVTVSFPASRVNRKRRRP